ncbi:MAG: hypothetical protein AAF921_05295 [Cyanobacteria bacterium P01_D01_bin.44]
MTGKSFRGRLENTATKDALAEPCPQGYNRPAPIGETAKITNPPRRRTVAQGIDNLKYETGADLRLLWPLQPGG